MRNQGYSKLVYLMAAFPPEEYAAIRDYLHSPVFNKRKEPIRLFEYCVQHCMGNPPVELEDEAGFRAVWPEVPVDLRRIAKLKSELVGLVLGYLAFRNWKGKPVSHELAVIEELNQLRDESYLPLRFKKTLKNTEKEKELGTFKLRLDLNLEYMSYVNRNALRKKENHLSEMMTSLQQLLLAHALKFAYVSLNQHQIVNAAPLQNWLSATVAQVKEEELASEPLLEIYYLLYKTHAAGANPNDLQRLKELVISHSPQCSRTETLDLFTGALNNFNRQAREEGSKNLEDVFSLFKAMVEIYVRKKGGKLPPPHFKNIVSLGMRLGQFKWVKGVLEEGPKLLTVAGPVQDLAIEYNTGVFYFYQKEYRQARRSFNTVLADSEDIFYGTDARAYLLMCHYEAGDTLEMESLMHSFKMYLRRHKGISKLHQKSYLDFLLVYGRLLNTPPRDRQKLEKLHGDILALKSSAGKEWLLEKTASSTRHTPYMGASEGG